MWRHDIIPEIMDGRNIADYVDPEIAAKLAELEREEELLLASSQDLRVCCGAVDLAVVVAMIHVPF